MRLFKSLPQGSLQQVPPEGAEHPLLTGKTAVGLMSGENPHFPSAPGGNQALKQDLEQLGLKHEETDGRYGTPERSFIVYGPTREQMYQLGQKYGQESVVHSAGGQHELLYTNGENAGKHNPGTGTYDYWPEGAEPPEDYYTKLPNQGFLRLHFNFDKLDQKPLAVQPQVAPTAPATPTPAAPTAPAAPMTKHEIGHKLYTALTKALAAQPVVMTGGPHPHAYDWHDGHTDHHFAGGCMGGVLVSGNRLQKHDPTAPASHPHTDGAIPGGLAGGDESARLKNDQAAGVGVKTYQQFALPFGKIDHEAKQRGGSNLFHYNYNGKNAAVNQLVANHGYQTYYAGGKFGKPDLANKNYNTKHLMVYDPTDSEASFGDPTYTDSWRKTHELSHALVYPELNKIYGEGRRIGKLGHHRSLREAQRAVHWEWLAAHKQRELNKQLGIDVDDATFNRELNTVMHDAAHRAVTGKFTEPSGEGFVPHSHQVPLETSLGLVRDAARNLGLQGEHDLIRKSEGDPQVADDKKLNIPQALQHLRKGLQERIDQYAQGALELRKKEQSALAKGEGKKLNTNSFHGDGNHLGPSVQAPGAGSSPRRDACAIKKDDAMGEQMLMAEGSCKACGDPLAKCNCSKAEAYAKGEQQYHKDLDLKAGKPVDSKLDEGSGGDVKKGKSLAKGAMPGAAPGAAGAAPAMPKPAMPKTPKLPGMGASATPKPAGMGLPKPAAPKPPAMGAGVPAAKNELAKQSVLGERSMAARKKFGERTQAEQDRKLPEVRSSVGNLMDNMLAGKKDMKKDLTWDPKQKATGAMPSPFAAPPPTPAKALGTAKPQALAAKPAPAPALPAGQFKQPPAQPAPVVAAPAPKVTLPGAKPAAAPGLPDLSNFQSLASKPAAPAVKLPGAHLAGKK